MEWLAIVAYARKLNGSLTVACRDRASMSVRTRWTRETRLPCMSFCLRGAWLECQRRPHSFSSTPASTNTLAPLAAVSRPLPAAMGQTRRGRVPTLGPVFAGV